MSDFTFIYSGDAPRLSVHVLEYEDGEEPRILVRAGMGAAINSGFDLPPEKALELAKALTRHANALLAKEPA
jgi:hypothetical protein